MNLRSAAVALLFCAAASSASAQGYVVQAVASAVSPGCSDSEATGLVAQPNASASASCVTSESAVADAESDLASATVAIQLDASPTVAPSASNAAGLAEFVDHFLFDVPDGLLGPDDPLLVGVTFVLDGAIPPGSAPGSGSSIFANYRFSLLDSYSPANPNGLFLVSDTIEAPFAGPIPFTGTIEVRQPFLEAELAMNVGTTAGLQAGSLDLLGSVELSVPTGVTWSSSSGVLLTAPEPGANAALIASILALAARRARSAL